MAAKSKHKSPGISREISSLYLENQAIPVALDQFQAKPKFDTRAERWAWRGFKSSARGDGLALYHWAKANEAYTDYFYARYNAKTKPYQYTDKEYEKCIEPLDKGWSRVETDYLLHLCCQYDLRFVVIHDRYYSHTDCPSTGIASGRVLEDLKERYYAICRALIQHRAGEDSRDPDDLPLQATNKLADDLALLRFDKAKEQERKQYLEALFKRTKEEVEEEEMLISEARRIEANERRLVQEREMLLQSHSLFEDAPSSSAISSVKVQFAQATDSAPLIHSHSQLNAPGDATPRGRKGGPDGSETPTARPMKKQKSTHGVASAARTKAAATANKAQSAGARALSDVSAASVAGAAATLGRRSMSPSKGGPSSVKLERLDATAQFGPMSFATEDHLVHPVVVQAEAGELGMLSIPQRDAKLGPGVFLRSDKLHPIPKNKLDMVKQFMEQLSLNFPNTIWPRPVMATPAVCDRFDSLQSTIIPLLDCKKTADKLDTEIQVLRARKRMLVDNIGEGKAQAVLNKLPPFDPSKVPLTRAVTPSIADTPVASSRQHQRKGSNASTRKKTSRD
ncbi:swr complex subunit [Coemansia sp. RSA 1813]|nr:swr complex subunit [Coemansia sp. RSA 1646]KAJ1770358.1 swr complex subunit [Coemansia sp. RSA 1843]KAJ2089430.1 swr complex subunit [Coemansia sp. RSA 986]KAJ2214933.1 swr complex subunit [Coemansia sp. RSA 487]KAJ2568216.1 swr complex subunit [Coemansia sp. RSA 1813]